MVLVIQGLAQIPEGPPCFFLSLSGTLGYRQLQWISSLGPHTETFPQHTPAVHSPARAWRSCLDPGGVSTYPAQWYYTNLVLSFSPGENPSLLVSPLRLHTRKHSPGWSLLQSSVQGSANQDEPRVAEAIVIGTEFLDLISPQRRHYQITWRNDTLCTESLGCLQWGANFIPTENHYQPLLVINGNFWQLMRRS